MLMAKPLKMAGGFQDLRYLQVNIGGAHRARHLQQNATHRTNFFEGVVDGVTIPGYDSPPMVGPRVFPGDFQGIATSKSL